MRTCAPWLCSQTRYRLRYGSRHFAFREHRLLITLSAFPANLDYFRTDAACVFLDFNNGKQTVIVIRSLNQLCADYILIKEKTNRLRKRTAMV